jgi:hypothetical protein
MGLAVNDLRLAINAFGMQKFEEGLAKPTEQSRDD